MPTKTANPVEDATATVTAFAEEANKKFAALTDETNKKIGEYLQQAAATRTKVALAVIDSYEESALRFVDSYENAVADTKLDWLKDAIAPQTAAARELTSAYVATARQLVN
jgi:hypothetical protein